MTKRRPSSQRGIERICLLSTLWPICYSSVVLFTNSYLLYQSIKRYNIYRAVIPGSSVYLLWIICISAILLPAVLVISFIRLGSYTNDAVQVGFGLLKKEIANKAHPSLNRLYLGAPPIASVLHVMCAYLLLIVNVFTVAKGRQLGIYTDMSSDGISFDMTSLRVSINSSDNTSSNIVSIPSTSPETANFVLSLVVYSYRTVAVFWQSSRLFTAIYWMQMVAALLLHILSYLGLQVLYTGLLTTKQRSVFLLGEESLIFLYILGNCVLFVSSWCVFHFGYGVVREKIYAYLKTLGYRTDEGTAYLPHGLALGSILLYVGCNAPIMYDYVSMYSDTKNGLLIAHLISCVAYMLLWIVLWFLFTIKQNWQFKINDLALKRYAILQNRLQPFPETEAEVTNDEASSSHSNTLFHNNNQDEQPYTTSEDNISNSTSSTVNGATPRSANGILNYKVHSRQKRKSSEQKVKFQEATRIVIETNLDSDLDTIPESDTECADSAMFSGSGGSNDSNGSQSTQQQNMGHAFSSDVKPKYKDLILNPRKIQLLDAGSSQQRMWSSTGDLNSSLTNGPASGSTVCSDRPQSVISNQYTSNYMTAPYTPRNLPNSKFISSGHRQMFDDPGMSSAV